jgi:hypothetical protein
MKKIRLMISMVALFVMLVIIGASSFKTASADAAVIVPVGARCNCQYQSGAKGVIRNGDCVVENCWTPIETALN